MRPAVRLSEARWWVPGMAHLITEECVLCTVCVEACPEGAIAPGPPVGLAQAAADRYRIDPDLCTDCGACVEVCPQECILAPEALQPITGADAYPEPTAEARAEHADS